MAKNKDAKKIYVDGELYYARIFIDNIDTSDWHEKTEGQFNTVFVPKDEETLQLMIDSGFPEESMGNRMIKPIPAADNRLGVKLKRPNKHPSGIEDFGGAPIVTHGTTNKPWDYIEDGALGNGTKAKVKLSIYGEGSNASVRIEKVGILEHVPFDDTPAEDRW